jgi:peptidyl-tRNA hydrolase
MSPGKLAAQVSHASMAFLTNNLQKHSKKILDCDSIPAIAYDENGNKYHRLYKRNDLCTWAEEAFNRNEPVVYYRPVNSNDPYGKLELCEPTYHYQASINFEADIWEGWINDSFTKIVCEAKNRNQLYKAAVLADSLGLKENKDYFIIRDNCLTELTPEDPDGRTPTCIGFKPLPEDIVNQISHKFQLYK